MGLSDSELPSLRILCLRIDRTPNPPTNIVPTNIARLKLSGKSPLDMRIPPLKIKITLESNSEIHNVSRGIGRTPKPCEHRPHRGRGEGRKV